MQLASLENGRDGGTAALRIFGNTKNAIIQTGIGHSIQARKEDDGSERYLSILYTK